MALPNPGMDAVPFTPLTAEFLDDMIENIESLSDGTGFENGAITTNTLAESAVTRLKLDISTFGSSISSDSSSIVLPPGFKYLVIHTLNYSQANDSATSVFIYNVTGMPSTTLAAKAGTQAQWQRSTSMGIINGGVTVARTNTTFTNSNVGGERFVAIPLVGS